MFPKSAAILFWTHNLVSCDEEHYFVCIITWSIKGDYGKFKAGSPYLLEFTETLQIYFLARFLSKHREKASNLRSRWCAPPSIKTATNDSVTLCRTCTKNIEWRKNWCNCQKRNALSVSFKLSTWRNNCLPSFSRAFTSIPVALNYIYVGMNAASQDVILPTWLWKTSLQPKPR